MKAGGGCPFSPCSSLPLDDGDGVGLFPAWVLLATVDDLAQESLLRSWVLCTNMGVVGGLGLQTNVLADRLSVL